MYSTPHLVSDTLPPSQVGPGGGGYHIYIYYTLYNIVRIYSIFMHLADSMQVWEIGMYGAKKQDNCNTHGKGSRQAGHRVTWIFVCLNCRNSTYSSSQMANARIPQKGSKRCMFFRLAQSGPNCLCWVQDGEVFGRPYSRWNLNALCRSSFHIEAVRKVDECRPLDLDS